MAKHPAISKLGKLTPEEIGQLADHLVKIGAPMPNLQALNPALHALQVMNAAKGSGKKAPPLKIKGDGTNSIPKTPPAPTPTVTQTMKGEGVNQGITGGDPVRGRNPFIAFGSA